MAKFRLIIQIEELDKGAYGFPSEFIRELTPGDMIMFEIDYLKGIKGYGSTSATLS